MTNYPFRRIHRLAYKCNVLTADLDFYHKKGRFEGKTPEEVWEVIREEKQYFLEKLRVIAVKSGNGLQLYVPCQTFYFNGGRTDMVWERFNEAFNFEFKEYGSDPKCVSDKSRVYRYPGSKNWKGDDAITVKILSDINSLPIIYNNDEIRYALDNSLFKLKDYSFVETEKLIYYGENFAEDDEDIAEEYEEIADNNNDIGGGIPVYRDQSIDAQKFPLLYAIWEINKNRALYPAYDQIMTEELSSQYYNTLNEMMADEIDYQGFIEGISSFQ